MCSLEKMRFCVPDRCGARIIICSYERAIKLLKARYVVKHKKFNAMNGCHHARSFAID